MFGSRKKNTDNPVGDIETIIGQNTTITGKLSGSGNMRIDGHIDGDVSATGAVVIGESGVVQGNVVQGNIKGAV